MLPVYPAVAHYTKYRVIITGNNMQEKTDYYVYVHKRKDNGAVFYVGHGRGNRCLNNGRTKTKDWLVVETAAGGHFVEKIHENLTKKEAELLEEGYIVNSPLDWILVNKRLPVKRLVLDVEELRSMFEYSKNSPSGLVWKSSRFRTFIGKPAGGHQKTGDGKVYWVVRKQDRLFLAHRIVYVIVTGKEIPEGFVIDHTDGNGLNNNIENLRCVTQSENSTNSIKRLSSVGEKFISVSEGNVILRFRSQFYGKITRKFAINKFGYDAALQLAIQARDSFLENFK